MAKYKIADQEVHNMARDLIADHHGDLAGVGVIFDILFAYGPTNEAGERTGPALKANGYQCSASVSIVPLKWRVRGMGDAEILLDGDRWPELTPEQQQALLDHELMHVQIARDAEGSVINDNCGRPKLKMKLHDFHFGWFTANAARHGANSPEVEQATAIVRDAGNVYFQTEMTLPGAVSKRKPRAIKNKEEPAA